MSATITRVSPADAARSFGANYYRAAYGRGVTVSQLLEQQDPTEQYGQDDPLRQLDAFERVMHAAGLIPNGNPRYGIRASTWEEATQTAERRALVHEMCARIWRQTVGYSPMTPLTRALIAISNGFVSYLPFTIATLFGLVILVTYVNRQPNGKRFFHKTFLRLPVMGPVLRKIAVARFTRTLGTLLQSGVPILDALEHRKLLLLAEDDTWVPARDPHAIELNDVLDAVRHDTAGPRLSKSRDIAPAVEAARIAEQALQNSLKGKTVAEIKEAGELAGSISKKYPSMSQTEAMHTARNIRSVVGHFEEATKIIDPLMKLRVVALGAHPEKAAELGEDFEHLRWFELPAASVVQ